MGQLINWVEERRGKRACPPSPRRIIAPARKEIAHIVGRIDNPSYRIGLRLRISRAGAILPFAHSAEERAVRGGHVFRDDARRSIHCQIVRLPKNLSADSRRGRPEQPIAARFILTDGWPLFGQESLDWQQLRARPISLCGLATLAEMAASAAKGMARGVRLVWTARPRALCGNITDPPEKHENSVERALDSLFELARFSVIVHDRHRRCAQ